MYIAIEGVKGVGKTTLIEMLKAYMMSKNIEFMLACPTKDNNPGSILEKINKAFPILIKSDYIKERIYATRSNHVAKSTNWNSPIILGDRSIVSSYVSRFWKYDSPEKQIKRVNELEPTLPAPDYVIYLKADLTTIINRIRKRMRCYGREDETKKKLILDSVAYEYIKNEQPIERLSKTKWITLEAKDTTEKVFIEAKKIIDSLITNN